MGKTIRGTSKKQKKDLIKSFQAFRQNRQTQRRVQLEQMNMSQKENKGLVGETQYE